MRTCEIVEHVGHVVDRGHQKCSITGTKWLAGLVGWLAANLSEYWQPASILPGWLACCVALTGFLPAEWDPGQLLVVGWQPAWLLEYWLAAG